jgi:RimJ/RimL family protein N-acetyltransferase
MTVSIIQAEESDAERVRAYYANLLSEKIPYILANPVPSLQQEQEFVRKHDGKQSVLLLAISDNQLVGMAGFNRAAHPQNVHCCSFGISVARAHRGERIGARLIETGVEW